jgi:hypothetical protein
MSLEVVKILDCCDFFVKPVEQGFAVYHTQQLKNKFPKTVKNEDDNDTH